MIVLATPETAAYVAGNLRKKDRETLARWFDGEPELFAYETARDSIMSWVAFADDGEPVCMFGADGDVGDEWGAAWMFSTEKVGRAKWLLCREASRAIEFSRNYWPELRVRDEGQDRQQMRFLRFFGFRMHESGEYLKV